MDNYYGCTQKNIAPMSEEDQEWWRESFRREELEDENEELMETAKDWCFV